MKSLWSNLGTVLCAVELCTKSASAGSGPVHSESNARGCFQMLSLSSLGHQCCALGFFDSGSVSGSLSCWFRENGMGNYNMLTDLVHN